MRKEFPGVTSGWEIRARELASLAYLTTGGFSKPQIGPEWFAYALLALESKASKLPRVFGTRLLVRLEKQV